MSDSETSRSPDRERSPVRARSEEQERQDQEDAAPAEFKCFVGGISFQYNDEELKNVFSEFNPKDAKVMMDKISRRSRGFGFVWFPDEQSRQAAIDAFHNKELTQGGRTISVSRAIPQSQTAPGTPADKLRRGQTVPRDRGPVYRSGDFHYRDDRYGGGGYRDRAGYRDDYRRSDDYRRDDYRSDRYGGGYDRGYGGDGGGGGGGTYRPGYGYMANEREGGRSYDRGSAYDSRGGGGGGGYYDYPPRDPYGPPPGSSSYDRPAYYPPPPIAGGGGGGGPPPRGYDAPPPADYRYGGDRYDRQERRPGPYDRPPPRMQY